MDHLFSMILGGPGKWPGVRRYHVAFSDGEEVTKTHDLDVALRMLEGSMRFWLGMSARGRLFVHAGAVGLGGTAMLLPAQSEGGKSTLVHALLEAGATYLSDEYAVLDARGRVHPYPLDLTLHLEAEREFRRVAAAELGAPTAVEPMPVGLVLATRFRPGASFRPRKLSPGQSVLAILAHALTAQLRPRFAFGCLSRVVERAPVFAGDRPDTDSVITWLERQGMMGKKLRNSTGPATTIRKGRYDEASTAK